MVKIGKYNILKVLKERDFGVFLDGGTAGEILMPKSYVPEGTQVGDDLYAFIYFDSEDRIIATTLKPFVTVGSFAFLQVKQINNVGAFLDWGLPKDLFMPFAEQKQSVNVNDFVVVYIYHDEKTNRIVASSKLDKYIDKGKPDLKVDEEVDLLIYQQTDLGYKALINNQYTGLLFNNELFKPVNIGERHIAYIKQIRSDYKIDLILRKIPSISNIDTTGASILNKLDQAGGHMAVGDKSSADEIYNIFGISKKLFKKTIGNLYRQRLITIDDDGIRLIISE